MFFRGKARLTKVFKSFDKVINDLEKGIAEAETFVNKNTNKLIRAEELFAELLANIKELFNLLKAKKQAKIDDHKLHIEKANNLLGKINSLIE
jgi:hypothetical protein